MVSNILEIDSKYINEIYTTNYLLKILDISHFSRRQLTDLEDYVLYIRIMARYYVR